jgi:hypothetical protein
VHYGGFNATGALQWIHYYHYHRCTSADSPTPALPWFTTTVVLSPVCYHHCAAVGSLPWVHYHGSLLFTTGALRRFTTTSVTVVHYYIPVHFRGSITIDSLLPQVHSGGFTTTGTLWWVHYVICISRVRCHRFCYVVTAIALRWVHCQRHRCTRADSSPPALPRFAATGALPPGPQP